MNGRESTEKCQEWCPLADSEFCPKDPEDCPLSECLVVKCPAEKEEAESHARTS